MENAVLGRRRFIRSAALASIAVAVPPRLGSAAHTVFGGTDEFFRACSRGDAHEVDRLLRIDPRLLTATNEDGLTGYAISVLNGHPHVAGFLKKRGYVSDAHEAALAGDWDRFEAAVEDDPECVDRDHPIGGTTMYAAAAGGVGADMWRVYAAMATPNANPRGAAGATPLQAALNYQNRSVAELTAAAILSNDGNPNPEPNALPAPLLQAAGRGSRELTEMLIQYGAEPAVVDQRGRSATDLAAANKHTDVVRLLARQHEIPRACWSGRAAVDAYGQPYVVPPMRDIERVSLERIVSVSHRQVEAVRELIRSDPRLAHAAATTGERGVEAGAHMGNPEIVSTLLEAGAPYSLATAAMRNDLAHARALLNNDPARINERGAHGFPLLWYPVIGGGDRDMLQLLLDSGAHIEDHHFLGTTALHLACRRGQAETVELLVENGADVNRRGRKFGGQPASPLEMAIASGEERVIGFLKSRGARD